MVLNNINKFPDKFPARLHVLLARKSHFAVVIRRGPSKRVCTIGWDRQTDQFFLGQWLKGRIYERRSDLSPNGQYLIYFALNGKWHSEVRGSWTAISKAPYLKAMSLWAKGDGWHGGGLFLSNTDFWLNEGYGQEHQQLQVPSDDLKKIEGFPFQADYGGECPGVYYHRLQREGWKLLTTSKMANQHSATIFEKTINPHWKLQKIAYSTSIHPMGRGCYYDEHRLLQVETGEIIHHVNWEWAEVDGNRLVWAEKGQLFAGKVTRTEVKKLKKLYDFNEMVFEKLKAPY